MKTLSPIKHYYLVGGVFAFYFGLRTIEKKSGEA